MSAQTFSTPTYTIPLVEEVWISAEDVIRLTGWSLRHVQRKVALNEIISRDSDQVLANGRAVREFLLSSLPEIARDTYAQEQLENLEAKRSTALAKRAEQSLLPLVGIAPEGTITSRAALPDPKLHAQAMERWEILKPVIEFKFDPTCCAQVMLADGKPVRSESRLMQWLCQQHDVSLRTLKSWKSRYVKGGLPALADKPRADKGTSRWMEQHPDAKLIVAATYLESNRSKAAAYDALVKQCHLLGLTPDELPRYETVRAWLDSDELPDPLKILARQGERKLNETCAPYLQRAYDMPANEIWISDHMIHDMIVRNDCFEGIAEDAQMRLRLTALLDMRSRKVIGYCWTPEGSSRSIATAWRMALSRYAPPKVFYVDNGKDYVKFEKDGQWGRTEANEQYLEDAEWMKVGLLYRLGVGVQHCLKYHPQSKHIERFFRTLHMHFDSLFPHYTTGNAYNRPDATNIAMAEHSKLLRMGQGHASSLLPASEFIAMAACWIESDYNAQHHHRGQGMDKHTPNEVYDSFCPITERKLVDPAMLDELYWTRVQRRVDSCAIRFGKRRYVAASADSSAALYLANNSDVLLWYDPNDDTRAVVTSLDGRKRLASVQVEQLMPHSAEANDVIAASMQERRRLRNATAETIRTVRRQAAAIGHKNGFQRLRETALLPEAVGSLVNQRVPKTRIAPDDNAVAPKSAAAIAASVLEEIE